MKAHLLLHSICLLSFLVSETGCLSQVSNDELSYLEVDSVYKTPEEKNKFKELSEKFKTSWRDSTNCYMEKYFAKPSPGVQQKKILDYKVVNILHSSHYDSLAVIIVFYAAFVDEKG